MQEKPSEQKAQTPPDAPECMMISEKQFMRDHTLYSAVSSWLFALAGATNIGLLSVLASKVLTAVEQGKPIFKSNDPAVEPVMNNKKYNRVALMMMGFGGACMALSNWLESKKIVTEWQLGAGKLQRKMSAAEERTQKPLEDQAVDDVPIARTCDADTLAAASPSKNWSASVPRQSSDPAPQPVNRFRHG